MIQVDPVFTVFYKCGYSQKINIKHIDDYYSGGNQANVECVGITIEFYTHEDVELALRKSGKDMTIMYVDFNIMYVYENCFSLMCEFTMCTYKKVNDLIYIFYIGYCNRLENPEQAIPYIRELKIDSLFD